MHYRVKNGLIDQIAFYPIIFSSLNKKNQRFISPLKEIISRF